MHGTGTHYPACTYSCNKRRVMVSSTTLPADIPSNSTKIYPWLISKSHVNCSIEILCILQSTLQYVGAVYGNGGSIASLVILLLLDVPSQPLQSSLEGFFSCDFDGHWAEGKILLVNLNPQFCCCGRLGGELEGNKIVLSFGFCCLQMVVM